MSLRFERLQIEDLAQFKVDMQEAFQLGAKESGYLECGEQILSEKDINHSLLKKDAVAYKAVSGNEIVGGAVITVNKIEQCGYLDFLYVKYGMQGHVCKFHVVEFFNACHKEPNQQKNFTEENFEMFELMKRMENDKNNKV